MRYTLKMNPLSAFDILSTLRHTGINSSQLKRSRSTFTAPRSPSLSRNAIFRTVSSRLLCMLSVNLIRYSRMHPSPLHTTRTFHRWRSLQMHPWCGSIVFMVSIVQFVCVHFSGSARLQEAQPHGSLSRRDSGCFQTLSTRNEPREGEQLFDCCGLFRFL